MAFIPKNALWYIAEVVLEITVEGDDRNVVQVNYLLVRAQSPDEAHEKAMALGAEHQTTYLNPGHKTVTIAFLGLRNLSVVYESLEDGAELLYEEKVGVSHEALRVMICAKESLSVFRPIQASSGPNYASEEIQQEARSIIGRASSEKE